MIGKNITIAQQVNRYIYIEYNIIDIIYILYLNALIANNFFFLSTCFVKTSVIFIEPLKSLIPFVEYECVCVAKKLATTKTKTAK